MDKQSSPVYVKSATKDSVILVTDGMAAEHSEYGNVLIRHSEELGWHYLRWGYAGYGIDFENVTAYK